MTKVEEQLDENHTKEYNETIAFMLQIKILKFFSKHPLCIKKIKKDSKVNSLLIEFIILITKRC